MFILTAEGESPLLFVALKQPVSVTSLRHDNSKSVTAGEGGVRVLINAIIISASEKRFCAVICCRCVMSSDIPFLRRHPPFAAVISFLKNFFLTTDASPKLFVLELTTVDENTGDANRIYFLISCKGVYDSFPFINQTVLTRQSEITAVKRKIKQCL